ncbi:MAG: nuclear transport factor 2 family protein [Phenylobacterium sp.]|nr:nuclear transport factor 2 family protein [Phenylobacterium sp.]
MAIYSMNGDRGRFEDMAATFAQDGVLETTSGPLVGRDAIVESLTAARRARGDRPGPRVSFTQHNLTTCHIEFDSPTAAGAWTYFFVVTDFGFDHAGVYIDRLAPVGERWLFVNRRVKIRWDSPISPYHRAAPS